MESLHAHKRALSTLSLLASCDEFTQHATLHTAQHATPSTHVSVTLLLCRFGPSFQLKTQFSNERTVSGVACCVFVVDLSMVPISGSRNVEKPEKFYTRAPVPNPWLNPKSLPPSLENFSVGSCDVPWTIPLLSRHHAPLYRGLATYLFPCKFLSRRRSLHGDNSLEMYSGGIWLKSRLRIPTSVNWKILKFYSVTQRKFVGTTLK
jgi:hypothetical protein